MPAHDALALDEAGGLVRALASLLATGQALAGALVLDVDDGEPQELDDGVVAGGMPAGLGDLAELVVQALDAIGGVWPCFAGRCSPPLSCISVIGSLSPSRR